MRYIVQAVHSRESFVEEMRGWIPGLVVHYDENHDGTTAFIETLRMAKNEPHIHLEDDVIPCKGFLHWTRIVAATYTTRIVQLFNYKQSAQKTRLVSPREFCWNQGLFIPRGYASAIADYMEAMGLDTWRNYDRPGAQNFDQGVASFLKARREQFVRFYPSLVQHRVAVSAVAPARSSKRQSPWFADDVGFKP